MDLLEIPLFSELDSEDIKKITSLSREVNFNKDEYIFHEGDAFQGLYIVLKGSVKIFKISPHGKEYILHLLREKQLFGDVPLFTGGDCPASVQVLEDSTLLFIPKNEFLKLLENNAQLGMRVMAGFAKRLKSISVKAEDETLKEVINRLADYLLKEAERSGTAGLPEPYAKLTLSNPTLAAYLGTITETISRAFRKMKDQGIIRIHERTVFIQDLEGLKKLAE